MRVIHKVTAIVAFTLSALSSGATAGGTKGVQELLKLGLRSKVPTRLPARAG